MAKSWAAALVLPAVMLAGSTSPEARKAFQRATDAAGAGRAEEARQGFERAVALDPRFAEAWSALGRLHAKAERAADAKRCFETAIRIDPGFLEPYLPLAILQNAGREWTALLETTDRLLKLDPYGQPLGWFLNAAANYNLKRFDAAERSALEARKLDPQGRYPRWAWLLAEVALVRRDLAAAAERYREFLRLAPSDPLAETLRGKLAEIEKQARAAPEVSAAPTFRATTELALVRFRVTPDRREFVTDLRPEDIEVREDGAPQRIALFEGGRFYPQSAPVEITLLFDCSGSVKESGTLDPHVFQTSLLDEFENVWIAIYGFSDDLTRFTPPTRDRRRLADAMKAVLTVRSAGTPLFGTIAEVAREAAATGRRGAPMLVVFSDGFASYDADLGRVEEARRAAVEGGVSVYPVVLSTPIAPSYSAQAARRWTGGPMVPSANLLLSASEFAALGEATGGQAFSEIASGDVLPRMLRAIARQIRYDYVVGYYPESTGQEKRHRVEVVWRSKPRGQIVGGSRVTVH